MNSGLTEMRMGLGRVAVLLLGFGLITLGVWQLGGGVYIKAKAAVGQVLLADSWADAKTGIATPKPWSWADIWPVARLTVPRLGIDTFVLNGRVRGGHGLGSRTHAGHTTTRHGGFERVGRPPGYALHLPP